VAEGVLQMLMGADVEGFVGAGRKERSGERMTWRNCYRNRFQVDGVLSWISRRSHIDERARAFLNRPLAGEWPHLWLDECKLRLACRRTVVAPSSCRVDRPIDDHALVWVDEIMAEAARLRPALAAVDIASDLFAEFMPTCRC